jgi:hypothetical protein
MTPDAQGRFCAHCQRSVIDFTGWSDKMLYDFFTKNKGETCGRFRTDQLNRTISIPPQPRSTLYRVAVALGLTILVAQAQEVHARVMPPLVEQNVLAPVTDSIRSDTAAIKGQIVDEHNEGLPGARVLLLVDQNNTQIGTTTNIDGYFTITLSDSLYQSLTGKDLQLQIQTIGYYTKLICVDLTQPFVGGVPLALKKMSIEELRSMGAIISTVDRRPPLADPGKPGPNKTFTTQDLRHMGY